MTGWWGARSINQSSYLYPPSLHFFIRQPSTTRRRRRRGEEGKEADDASFRRLEAFEGETRRGAIKVGSRRRCRKKQKTDYLPSFQGVFKLWAETVNSFAEGGGERRESSSRVLQSVSNAGFYVTRVSVLLSRLLFHFSPSFLFSFHCNLSDFQEIIEVESFGKG